MNVSDFIPVWNQVEEEHRELLLQAGQKRTYAKGEMVHNGSQENGLFMVCSGQLRVYLRSNDGGEITIYRLFERDICFCSLSYAVSNVQFDLAVKAEKNTEVIAIPAEIYKRVMSESVSIANYMNEIMTNRFSDVIWLLAQIMWENLDKRLADFLIEEVTLEGTYELHITHEAIGNHLGNPREVVTRMLKYFQNEGLVQLSRGKIKITDLERLRKLAEV